LDFIRLEGVLSDLEHRNGITQRWTTACEEYRMARDAAYDRSKRVALVKLHTKVVERWFLLCLKAKYAGKYFSQIYVFKKLERFESHENWYPV